MDYMKVKNIDSAVIMSVYYNDKAIQLYSCLWSLVNQTVNNFIIVICFDGAVNEDIRKLVKYYRNKFDNIIVLERDRNKGLASCLNHIIDYCILNFPGVNYYFRMDADDINVLDRHEIQRNFLLTHPDIDVLGGSTKEFGLYSKIIKKPEFDFEIKKNAIKVTPFIHPSVVFRKRVFENGFRYPVDTHLSEDLAMWFNLILSNYKLHNLQNVIIYYRLNSKTLHRRMSFKKAFSELLMRLRYIYKDRQNLILNIFYSFGHFAIRLMPVIISKLLYKILR